MYLVGGLFGKGDLACPCAENVATNIPIDEDAAFADSSCSFAHGKRPISYFGLIVRAC